MPIASYLKAFADLPDLQHPAPPSTSGEENIGIIPIFSDVYLDIDNCIAFAKAACYSRQTALLNTDARNYLPIKFYVEDILRESVLPVFGANGVSEEDILWFHAPPLPDTHAGVWGRLGKKLSRSVKGFTPASASLSDKKNSNLNSSAAGIPSLYVNRFMTSSTSGKTIGSSMSMEASTILPKDLRVT